MSVLRDTALRGKTGAAGEASSEWKKVKKVKTLTDYMSWETRRKSVKTLTDYMSWENLEDGKTQ